MAEVRKDILISIIAEKKLDAVDETIRTLERLESIINRVKGNPVQITGLDQVAQQLTAAASGAQAFGSTTASSLDKAKQSAVSAEAAIKSLEERVGQALTITKQVDKIAPDNTTSTQITAKGAEGSGLTVQADLNSQNVKVTENFEAQEQARQKAADHAEATELKKQRELGAIQNRETEEALAAVHAKEVALGAAQAEDTENAIAAANRKQVALGAAQAKEEEDHIAAIQENTKREQQYTTELEEEVLKREEIHRRSQDKIAADEEAALKRQQTARGQAQADEQHAHEEALRENSRRDNSKAAFENAIVGGAKVQAPELNVDQEGKIQKTQVAVNELTGATYKLNEANGVLSVSTKKLSEDFESSSGSIVEAAGKVLVWTIATGAVFGAIRSIGAAVDSFKRVEDASVSLARVGQQFASQNGIQKSNAEILASSKELAFTIEELKVKYGSVGDAADQAAVTFSKLGLTQKQVLEATKAALQAEALSGVDAARNAELLSTAFLSFKGSASDIPDILNKINVLQDTTRVGQEQLLEAVQRAGEVYHEAGGTFEQFAATTAVVSQVTGRSGAEIGNALKFISSKLGDATVQEKLFTEAGIGIRDIDGNLKPINDVLGELAAKFDTLNKAQQEDLAISLAGTRQRNILQAALSNYYEIQQKVIDQLTAANSVDRDVASVKETLANSVKSLVAAFEHLGAVLVNSGIGQILTKIAQAITFVVENFSKLGFIATAIVGAIAAYIAVMLLAGISTDGMSTAVTGLLTRMAALNTAMASSATSVLSFGAAEGTATASTVLLSEGLTSAIAAFGASLVAIAPLIIVLGVLAAAAYAAKLALDALKPPPIDIGEDSDYQKKIDALDDQAKGKANNSKADEARAAVAKRAAAELKSLDEQEAQAGSRSVENQKKREEAGRALARAFDLTGAAQERARNGEITAAEATELGVNAKKKANAELDKQIELQNKIVSTAKGKFNEVSHRIEDNNEKIKKNGPSEISSDEEEDNKTLEVQKKKLKADVDAAVAKRDLLDQQREESKNAEHQEHVYESLGEVKKKAAAINSNTDINFAVSIAGAADNTEKLSRELDAVNSKLAQFKGDKKLQAAVTSDPNIIGKEFHENIEQPLLKEKAKLERELAASPIKIEVKKFEGDLKARLGLEKNIAEQVAEATTPKEGRGLAKAQVDLQINTKQVGDLKAQAKAVQDQIGGRDQGDAFGKLDAAGQREVIALVEKRKSLLVEANNLSLNGAQLEANVVEQKLAGEIKISEEKRKQTDEARKALGLLSDEDLARTRVLAGKAQQPGFKGPSTDEFLNLDETSRKFLTNFQKTAPGLGVTDNVNPNDLFGANAFTGKSGKADQEILSQADVAGAIASLKNLRSFEGQSLDASVNNAVLTAQSIVIQNGNGSPGAAIGNGIGGAPSPNQTSVTVNIQGVEEVANRVGGAVIAGITNGINDIVRKLGEHSTTDIRSRPRETVR